MSPSLATPRLQELRRKVTAHRFTQTRKTDPELARGAILDVYNLSLAVFLFVSPWLFAYANGAARFDFWASSILIAALSAAAIVAFSDWEEWLNLLLGIWVISAPWLLGYTHTRAMHVSIGVGVIVAYLAGLRIWLAHYGERAEQQDGR